MSRFQKFLVALAEEMERGTVSPAELRRLALALDGVSLYYHEDLAMAAFGVEEDEDA